MAQYSESPAETLQQVKTELPDWARLEATDLPKIKPNVYSGPDVEAIRVDRVEKRRNLGVILISRAGEKRGSKTRWISRYVATSVKGDTSIPLHRHRGDASVVGFGFTSDKLLTKRALLESGVPTPAGKSVTSAEEATDFARALGAPIVLKPLSGGRGKGVSVDLWESGEIEAAFDEAAAFGPVLAEEFIVPAAEFRVLATADECFSVVRRVPPFVRGDGRSTIEELIQQKNAHRGTVPSTVGTRIPLGEATERFLSRGGATLDSVPPKGLAVKVGGVGGLSSGAEPQECREEVPERIKSVAIQCAQALPGLNWCGVDVIVTDDGSPFVLEANSSPGILGAAFPFFGNPRNLGGVIWELLADEGERRSNLSALLSPTECEFHRAPNPVALAKPTPLSRLLLEHMRDRGWETSRWSRSVVRATRGHETVWFSGTGTVNDLSTAALFAARHALVMRLARANNVPHVPYEIVSSQQQLATASERSGDLTIGTLTGSPWSRGIRSGKSVLTRWVQDGMRGRIVLQKDAQGLRVKVAATRDGTLLILGDQPASEQELLMASDVAQRVVRMVPQLNWAFVDVVIEASQNNAAALLEGIDRAPILDPGDLVLAGSIRHVLDFVEGLARGGVQGGSRPSARAESFE